MTEPVAPRPASSLMLLRDAPGSGLEVLMTVRHEQSGFAAGALVFPGGKVDRGDAALARLCPPGEAGTPFLPERIAAIRETFEESGILIARRRGGGAVDGALLAELQRRHREAGEPPAFGHLVEEAGLELASDALVRFAHWITPKPRPVRFDTQFFATRFPEGQEPAHDGRETVETLWTTPAAALAGAAEGRYKLVFVTWANLERLGESDDVAAALARAAAAEIATICPEIEKTAEGVTLRIPAGAGYRTTEITEGRVHRP